MDKELLFKPRAETGSGFPEDEIEVPGLGTVKVRGLSRFEVFHVQQADGTAARERRLLSIALLDPKLTEAEVGRWQKASEPGEMEPIAAKVSELSGMDDGAAKRAVKAFEADPDAEFPVLPGAEAGDDGGSPAGGDAG